ncbi:hypothetical protein, conserved [Leishmania donovani]|uniref:Uncharacterized protein n=1 Tax=Leishmania donovani TaxID=5661 RepID=E9BH63_LEIDO|nr:hypothetical protein, conserved [Leishmania donovani]TPP52323.1 hypothetical protein CGC21_16590 [Leishmania donovani]CBZ34589.1 hypothetical protein, conserved [Leishmania donovani]
MNRSASPPPASPSPASPSPSTMHIITVALCASSKKHQQSFDALREAGKLHNEHLLQMRQHSAARQAGCGDVSGEAGEASTAAQQEGCASGNRGMNSHSRSRRTSRATSEVLAHPARSRSTTEGSLSCSALNNCLFRFLSLNYDAQRHRMVLCIDGDMKETHQSSAAAFAQEGSKASAEQSPRVDAHAGTDETVRDEDEPSQSALMDEVDVVLHKVATFGTPVAIRALHQWYKGAQKRRSRRRRAPLIVVDPLEKVQLLMTRSMLCKLLNNVGDDGQPIALTPRTFMWDCPPDAACRHARRTNGSSAATPLGIHSFTSIEEQKEARANGTAAEHWWIAKPDESTGPAFTHHLVMWLTRDADVSVPAAVKAALPTEACRFILQELYVYALPVVLKVYCVGSHISVKANPTVSLLNYLWEHTRGSTVADVPVAMDSQDKAFFSTVASASTSRSQPTLSAMASSTDDGAPPATSPTMNATNAADAPPSPTELPQGTSSESASAEQSLIAWESMVVPADNWNAFLAPGTPAYTAISKLAQDLSGDAGIGLSLYGFDIVLVPQYLAHTYQRKGARGIGRTEGATVRYEGAAPSLSKVAHRSADTAEPVQRLPASHSMRKLPGAGASAPPSPVSRLFRASDMFDPASGAPTSLLLDSIPVVIDVNYFPGYKGVAEVNQHMLELIALKCMHLQDGSSSRTWHADTATGAGAKKRRCSMM